MRHLALPISGLLLALNIGAQAAGPEQTKFHGVINDFTPASITLPPHSGPWEVRGPWSLELKGSGKEDCKADFSAALTMERSDQGVMMNGDDFDNPMDRMAHTHHITLVDGRVTRIPGGIQVKGVATITADGKFPPPFGSELPTLTIEITGGNEIVFSNISVLFGEPAAAHFGSSPLHGAVRKSSDKPDERKWDK